MIPMRLYFAGELFDHKHLVGNYLLSKAIEQGSQSRFICKLPQDPNKISKNYREIRNMDLSEVIHADVVLCNFDGADIDSGTVVEFVIAKMLDIPTVILRTDFRIVDFSIDNQVQDPWNLMCSAYPRTGSLIENGIKLYRELGIEGMHAYLAEKIIALFDTILKQPSSFEGTQEIIQTYNRVIKSCGADLEELVTERKRQHIIDCKIEKGVYQMRNNKISSGACNIQSCC
jgi:nucleoside 2-deoxyribosyltransferase